MLSMCDELEEKQQRKATVTTKLRGSAFNALRQAETPDDLAAAWERISTNWSHLTDHPDSIPELRKTILDLGVGGLLSADAKTQKFERSQFATVRLREIAEVNYGFTASAVDRSDGPRFLRITDVKSGGVEWSKVPSCDISTSELERHLLQSGDIVFARTGATTGKSFLVEEPPIAVCASYMIRLRPNTKLVSPQFLIRYFNSADYWNQIHEGISGTAQGGFNSTKLGNLLLNLPAVHEQNLIVAKVDELIATCDELEKQLQHQQDLSSRLAIASTRLAG